MSSMFRLPMGTSVEPGKPTKPPQASQKTIVQTRNIDDNILILPPHTHFSRLERILRDKQVPPEDWKNTLVKWASEMDSLLAMVKAGGIKRFIPSRPPHLYISRNKRLYKDIISFLEYAYDGYFVDDNVIPRSFLFDNDKPAYDALRYWESHNRPVSEKVSKLFPKKSEYNNHLIQAMRSSVVSTSTDCGVKTEAALLKRRLYDVQRKRRIRQLSKSPI